jgi:predicted RecA/RadA family phage recombinase
MAIAEWRYGDQDQITFTAPTDLTAGTPVSLGTNLWVIPPVDYKAGEEAAGATSGVFEVAKASGAIALGAAVYWITASNNATATSTNNTFIGVAVKAAVSADTTVYVQLRHRSAASA